MAGTRRFYAAVGATQESARAQIDAVGFSDLASVTSTAKWSLGTPWAEILPLIDAGEATLLLVEGDPAGTPRVITANPDGSGGYIAQDFSKVIFVGVPTEPQASYVVVQLDANTNLVNPCVLRSKDIMWEPLHPDITEGGTDYDLTFDGGGIRAAGPLGGGSFFRAPAGGQHRIRLYNGAMTDGSALAAGEAITRCRPSNSGDVVLNIESYGGVIGPSTFINFVPWAPPPPPMIGPPMPVVGVVSANMDSKTYLDPNMVAPGGVSPVVVNAIPGKRDNSQYVFYDDSVTTPNFGVDNVQEALDALKNAVPVALYYPVSITVGNSPYTPTIPGENFIVADASGGVINVVLPPIGSVAYGTTIVIKKIDAVNGVLVSPDPGDGNIIDGSGVATLAAQYASVIVVSNGSSWWII